MPHRRSIPPVLAAFLAGACAPSDDPAAGGFFSGIAGLAGGDYERRLEQRRDELAGLEGERARLDQEQAALEAEQARVAAARREEEVRLAALDASLEALRGRLDEAGGAETRAAVELRELELEVEGLRETADAGAGEPRAQPRSRGLAPTREDQIAELERRRQKLEETLFSAIQDAGRNPDREEGNGVE